MTKKVKVGLSLAEKQQIAKDTEDLVKGLFETNEGTTDDEAASDGSRWAQYKQSEADRESRAQTYLTQLDTYVTQANNTYQTLNATLCSRAEILNLRED